ncbi:MAG: formylglycine-generating enzyme family protein [Verrucomicrobiales bacterium]
MEENQVPDSKTPRRDPKAPNPHAVPTRTIVIIFAVMIIGVSLGSILVLKHADPKPRRSRLGMGHVNVTTTQPGVREKDGMVWIAPRTFLMGSANGNPDEQPVHEVSVRGFWMDKTEVTNAEFEKFIQATGYKTVAERAPQFEGVDDEMNVPGSLVFTPPLESKPGANENEAVLERWSYVPGANWRQPEGQGSTIKGRENYPVVHIAWEDAVAYAKWAGKRLPTEAEWECAARGGVNDQPYIWGSEKLPGGKWPANIFQGEFPQENTALDGFTGAAPVASFPPNAFGLHDMAGNVWEWCSDWYRPDYYQKSPKISPPGPPDSYDPNEPGMPKKVVRGGSFLCSDSHCTGYRPSARMKVATDTGLNHTGFRCVRDEP